EPSAEAADEGPGPAVRQQHFALDRVVVERRPHRVALELVVLVVPDTERGAIRLQPAVEILPAGARADRMTMGCQFDLAFDNGNPILRIVVAVADAEIVLLAGPRYADLRQCRPRLRVLHFAFGRVVIARSIAGASKVQGVLAVADVNVAGAAGGAAIAAEIGGDGAGRALHPLRRNQIAD